MRERPAHFVRSARLLECFPCLRLATTGALILGLVLQSGKCSDAQLLWKPFSLQFNGFRLGMMPEQVLALTHSRESVVISSFVEHQPCSSDVMKPTRPIPVRCPLNASYDFANGDQLTISYVEDLPRHAGSFRAFFLSYTESANKTLAEGRAKVDADMQRYGTPQESNFTSQYFATWYDSTTVPTSWSISQPRFSPDGWNDIVPAQTDFLRIGVFQSSYDSDGYKRFACVYSYAEPRFMELKRLANAYHVRSADYVKNTNF